MKKILTWINVAAILAVDGLMQDQSDTTVALMGVHMDAIEKKLADDKVALAGIPSLNQQIADLTTRAETAEAALVNAAAAKKTAEDALTALQATHTTTTQELAAANAKLSKRPPNEGGLNPIGGGATKAEKAEEMDFQQKLFGALKAYGTPPAQNT